VYFQQNSAAAHTAVLTPVISSVLGDELRNILGHFTHCKACLETDRSYTRTCVKFVLPFYSNQCLSL
jgi:hypothetical protein